MPTCHEESLQERYQREAEIEERMMREAKGGEVVSAMRDIHAQLKGACEFLSGRKDLSSSDRLALLNTINVAATIAHREAGLELLDKDLRAILAQPVADGQAEPAPAQDDQAHGRNAEQVDEAKRIDKQCRDDVAAALGFVRGGNFAWSYLLTQIKECVRVAETASQQSCACRTPEAEATRQKDEAEAVKLQRILLDRHMDCRPADTGLTGWAAAVLSAPQPEQSGLVEALEESQSLLVSMLLEQRPKDEIEQQIVANRAALSAQGGE